MKFASAMQFVTFPRSLVNTLLFLAALAVGSSASAQQPASSDDSATQLDTIEVTGSRIKRVDVEGPAPIAIITRDQIDRLGYGSVKDVLGNLSYNAGGTFDAGQSFSFARGTQSIDLRGFGSGRTLILLDGRRLPVFPQGLGGTNAFVDLSTIPASMIERVEILLDGASAIYGSDAISGVVNIITRKNVAGTTLIGRVDGTSDGGGSGQRFQYLTGFVGPDASVQIVGEYTKKNVLRFIDRDYSNSDFNKGGRGSSFGSSFFTDSGNVIPDPDCGTSEDALGGQGIPTASFCRFDRSKYRQWIPDSDKGSLYLRADRKLGDMNTFARFGYYRGQQNVQLEPNPFSGGESAAFTSNRIYPASAFPIDPTFGGNSPGYVPSGAANDPDLTDGEGGYFFRRLVEFGPRGQKLTTESLNGLVGVSGFFFDSFNWELGVAHNEVRVTGVSPTVLSSVFDNEVSNNELDLFEPIPASVLAIASHTQVERGISRNTAVDGTVSGPLGFSVPGGPAQFAVHADFVDESYVDKFDSVSANGDVFDGGNGGGGDRRYTGIGAEFSLPVLDVLEIGLAARYDSYNDDSDVGSALSPSVKIGYRPLSTLLLRASFGESFRAPDLQRLFGATTAGFETVIDTPRCFAAGGTPGTPVNPADPDDPCLPVQSVPAVTGSNPNLKEEEGRNFNLGASWEIVNDLNLTFDYFEIKVEDIVSNLGAQQILDACASIGAFCGQIQRDPNGTLGTPSAGGSSFALISASALNLAEQESHGYDVRLSYLFVPGGIGKFNSALTWSHLTSVKVRSEPTGPLIQQLKNVDALILPQDRYSVETDWALSQFGATLRVDRVGKYPGGQSGLEVTSNEFVKPFTTVNVQGRFDGGKLGLIRLGVDNLLNEEFSTDPTFLPGTPGVQNQYLGEGTSFYSNPLGRVGYLQYEFPFGS